MDWKTNIILIFLAKPQILKVQPLSQDASFVSILRFGTRLSFERLHSHIFLNYPLTFTFVEYQLG